MIEIRDVTRRFGSFTALSRASFMVRGGEIVALLGPNGAGKTTASRIIAGILAPTEGDAIVDGLSVREDAERVRARCGLVTDSPSLYERMSLRSSLTYFGRLYDAKTTPDVFVLDADGSLRYRGAPDRDHDDPSQDAAWLRAALEAVLAGRMPDPDETRPVGCSIKWRA